MSQPLSFNSLVDALAKVFDGQIDSRQANKTRYLLSDAALAAFSVFFSQSPSFLAYQRDMEKRKGNSNAHSLFGIEKIPSDTHIRKLLDPVAPEPLFVPFRQVYRELEQVGVLERFKVKHQQSSYVLLAFDGTEHFSSEKLGCRNCTKRKFKNKTRYPVKLDER